MVNTKIRIDLLDNNGGYLDVLNDTDFPINMGVADIRDITQRSGAFSRTITLAGTKNNAKMLGHLYDLNIQTGSFDINKKQRGNVVQNNVVIMSEVYVQLISINKSQDSLTEDDKVTYSVEIKDSVADFFTTINGKELTDIELVNDGHVLTAADQIASWSHTAQDVYKYMLPWTPQSSYSYKELFPAIYAKTYWDKIHEDAGYTYEWRNLADSVTRFDKLLIPYNGDPTGLLPDSFIRANTMEVVLAPSNPQQYSVNSVPLSTNLIQNFQFQFLLGPTASADPNNEWNPYWPNNQFRPSQGVIAPDRITWTLEVEFDLMVDNRTGGDAKILNYHKDRTDMEVKLAVVNVTKNQIAAGQVTPTSLEFGYVDTSKVEKFTSTILRPEFPTVQNNNVYESAVFPNGITVLGGSQVLSYSLEPSNFDAGDILELRIWNDSKSAQNSFFASPYNFAGSPTPDVFVVARIFSARLRVSPWASGGIINGGLVDLNLFIPKKVKQSDFLKSIATMYNLYAEPDPNAPNKIIWKKRDTFYDEGLTVDWTEKYARDKEQEIVFLPELSAKSTLLTWKHDSKDPAAEAYKENVKKNYGQLRYTYSNEWVKGEDVKEIIFAPTINQITTFGANVPFYEDTFKPSTELRCVLDNGVLPVQGTFNVNNSAAGSFATATHYPYLAHINDPLSPTFDINFGRCDYYLTQITPTDNNLYYNNWLRTISNINNGKMLIAYFWLTEADMAIIRLSNKIRIDNGYFYINKIIDYNAASSQLTKVELITIEDEATVGVNTGNEVKPYDVKGFVDTITGDVVSAGRGNLDVIKIKALATERRALNDSILNSNQGNNTVYGSGNLLASGFNGVVVGDRIFASEPGIYVGDYKLISDGLKFNGIKIMDGGINQVMNLNKTNEVDFIDAGTNIVRNLKGPKARIYVDGGSRL